MIKKNGCCIAIPYASHHAGISPCIQPSSLHHTLQELYKYLVSQLLSGSSKGEVKALKDGSEALMPELHAGEGFDVEQV